MQVLSNKAVNALPRSAKAYVAYDSKLPGFGCRVTPAGAKSWIVEYRPNGGGRRVAKRRMTLGPVSTVPADAARKHAGQLLARAKLGEDVAGDKIARRKALSRRLVRCDGDAVVEAVVVEIPSAVGNEPKNCWLVCAAYIRPMGLHHDCRGW